MIPCIDANAINRNTIPTTQSTIQNNTPSNKYSLFSGLIRWAKPNNKEKKLTNSDTRRISILRKYDSRITINFITSNYIKQSKKIIYQFMLCNDIGQYENLLFAPTYSVFICDIPKKYFSVFALF